MNPRIFSGMQPSGELHIGNWLGALRQWVELSKDEAFDTIFCVVDAHAVTVDYKPKEMRKRILVTEIEVACRSAQIGCGDCKKILHEHLMAGLDPVQQRLIELRKRPDDVWDILRNGADRCRPWAQQTMSDVRKCMGLGTEG